MRATSLDAHLSKEVILLVPRELGSAIILIPARTLLALRRSDDGVETPLHAVAFSALLGQVQKSSRINFTTANQQCHRKVCYMARPSRIGKI